jgi:hypothetical protein
MSVYHNISDSMSSAFITRSKLRFINTSNAKKALSIAIQYHHLASVYPESNYGLKNTYADVDHVCRLLRWSLCLSTCCLNITTTAGTLGYKDEDIRILKDNPSTSFYPNRETIVSPAT